MELNWTDVIQNPQAYPDERLLRDMGEYGQRLVDLRKTVVPRDTAARFAQRAEVLAEEKRALEYQLAQALAAAPNPVVSDPNPRTNYPIDYTTDPLLGPLHKDGQRALEMAAANNQRLDDIVKMQQQLLQGLAQIPQVMRIEQLKQADPALDPARLLEFHQQRLRQPDLADTHRLMNYEQQMARARETGKTEGLEQAQRDLMANPQVPYAPYGPPQSIPLPVPQFTTMEQAEQAAMSDPEIIGLLYSSGA
jgi:hypothetical protein